VSSTSPRNLVVVVTHGVDDERSSVALAVANSALSTGLAVWIFLTSSGVDLVRKRSIDLTHVKPLEPLSNLVSDFMVKGGTIWACTPCVKSRGYTDADLLQGVVVTGSSAVHELIKAGAATLSF
jgi:predicted peroxiredoxin